MLILLWLACGGTVQGRPRFCGPESPFGGSCEEGLQFQGCPSDDIFRTCLMAEPLIAFCAPSPGGCDPIDDWLARAGWFDRVDADRYTVEECRSTDDSEPRRFFEVRWSDDDWTSYPDLPASLGYRWFAVWFDGASREMLGAEHGREGNTGSDGWCCGTQTASDRLVWGDHVDAHFRADCHVIQPGWPGWSR